MGSTEPGLLRYMSGPEASRPKPQTSIWDTICGPMSSGHATLSLLALRPFSALRVLSLYAGIYDDGYDGYEICACGKRAR